MGADGAHAAFLIVQHSLDKPFRSEFCSLQKMANRGGLVSVLTLLTIDANRMFETTVIRYAANGTVALYTIDKAVCASHLSEK